MTTGSADGASASQLPTYPTPASPTTASGAGRAPVPRAALQPKAAIIRWRSWRRCSACSVWQPPRRPSRLQSRAAMRHASIVEIAHGIVVWAHAQEAPASSTANRLQRLRLRRHRGFALRGQRIFLINDMQPRVVMHLIKLELNGRTSGTRDPERPALFKAFVAKVRESGKGFVAHQWPAGSDKPVDKISYVQGFEPWGLGDRPGIYVGATCARPCSARSPIDAAIVLALAAAGWLPLPQLLPRDGRRPEGDAPPPARDDPGDLTTSAPRPGAATRPRS